MLFKIFWLFSAILLLSFHSGGQQQDGSVFERRISIHAENQPLSGILDQISWQARVYFSYDASLVEADKMHTINAIEKSLYSILYELFNPNEFLLTELENQIIITKKTDVQKTVTQTIADTIPVKYFFLSGKILEQKKRNTHQLRIGFGF